MQSSRFFETKIRQARKHGREHAGFNVEQAIADAFAKIFSGPELLARELYEHFCAKPEKLFFIIDLFNNEAAEEEAQSLNKGDWTVLKEMVNRYAGELDIEQLQQIMQLMLTLKKL